MKSLTIESLESSKDSLKKTTDSFSSKNRVYADVRLELSEWKGTNALNGNSKSSEEDFSSSIGVRVIASHTNSLSASGYAGTALSPKETISPEKKLRELFSLAHKRALHSSELKTGLRKKYSDLGANIKESALADIKIYTDTVKAEFEKNPRDLDLEELTKRTESCSTLVAGLKGMASNSISVSTGFSRKIFASSEGALIDQSKALTESFVYLAAKGKAIETFYESMGRNAGPEVLEGYNSFDMTLESFSEYLAQGTIELSNAPAFTNTEEATVITDPWYNTLLCHEIVGHPSEADRALKREAAWAGRAWWFSGIDDNRFSKEVASEEVSVFSDPNLKEGYGYYRYDDEGVKAKKHYNIKEGILNEFINSRETATILGKEPNGGMRATSAELVPVIRMNNTCFAPGSWKKEELFEETKNGYYVVGQKTPSIGETRQNFKITCWKLFEIKNGEIKKLYRMGGLTSDSYSYLKNIDAAADDFVLYNVPNCGKGTPMQVMKLGNGGPHMRSRARVCGANSEVMQ